VIFPYRAGQQASYLKPRCTAPGDKPDYTRVFSEYLMRRDKASDSRAQDEDVLSFAEAGGQLRQRGEVSYLPLQPRQPERAK
jgi:hypothetical protein